MSSGTHPNLDNMIAIKIMDDLANEIGDEFLAAHRKMLIDGQASADAKDG